MSNSISRLIQIAKQNAMESNPQKGIYQFCYFLYEHLCLEDLVVFLPSEEGNIQQRIAFGKKGNSNATLVKNPIQLSLGEGIVGCAAAEKKERYEKDVRKCADYVSDITNCTSELAMPLIHRGKLLGVIDSEHPEYDFFSHKHVELFQLSSHLLSPLLYESTQKKNLSPRERFDELKALLVEKELFLQNDLSKKMVSDLLGLSSQYIASIISKFSKQSFPEMVNELRVNKAKSMLRDCTYANASISEIYYEVGFSSKSTFNRAFKKYTQLTPKAYKNSCLTF